MGALARLCVSKGGVSTSGYFLLDIYPFMDNTSYEVRREFLDGEDVLLSLSEEDRQRVESAIGILTTNPWPKQFGLEQIDERSFKITLPVEGDEIAVIYEVDVFEATVDLVQIKRLGLFRKALEWLSGLADFEPGTKP